MLVLILGVLMDVCWILSFLCLNKNSSWILLLVCVCWFYIFSLLVLNRGVKFYIRFLVGKVVWCWWNLKRLFWGWRLCLWCYKKVVFGWNYILVRMFWGRCYSRLMVKCWWLISRRLKCRLRLKVEKCWCWVVFLFVKINWVRIVYCCLVIFSGLGNYFVMMEKKMNDVS